MVIDMVRPLHQETGQDAQAGTDLQDGIARFDPKEVHLTPRDVVVGEEVLALALGRD